MPPETTDASATSGRARRRENAAQENREMKRFRWWLSSLLVAAFALGPALAALAGEPGEKPKRKKREGKKRRKPKGEKGGRRRGRKGLFEQVTAVCTLTDEQKVKFREACAKYAEARKATAKEVADLRKEMTQARKDKDRDKFKELAAKMKELTKAANDAQAEAIAVLTPEQKLAWEAQRMANMILGRLRKAELTQDQKDQILALCKERAKGLQGADEKSKRGALGALYKEVYEKEGLLTADQKTTVKAPSERKRKGPRERKPGRKRKKKKVE